MKLVFSEKSPIESEKEKKDICLQNMLYENPLIKMCFRIKHSEEKSESFFELLAKLASLLQDKKVNEANLKTQKRISLRKTSSTENCGELFCQRNLSFKTFFGRKCLGKLNCAENSLTIRGCCLNLKLE